MDKLFDLHIHSVYSDGKLTPGQICEKARAAGLDGFALTDHDTVDGLDEAAAEAARHGLLFVPGIEVSAYENCEVHILGLGINYKNPGFADALNEIKTARKERNRRILEKLAALGMNISEREIANERQGSSSRGQIERVMNKKGYAESPMQAFNEYLRDGAPADCGVVSVPPPKAISIIHKGNGKAFLAHPVRLNMRDDEKLLFIERLKGYGLDGIEVYYPGQDAELTGMLLRFCKENGLLISGGTDNHGNSWDAEIGSLRAEFFK